MEDIFWEAIHPLLAVESHRQLDDAHVDLQKSKSSAWLLEFQCPCNKCIKLIQLYET